MRTGVPEGVGGAIASEFIGSTPVPKGIVCAASVEGVESTVVPKGVGAAVVSKETVIIKSLFIDIYILLNDIRIRVIRYVQRHICK